MKRMMLFFFLVVFLTFPMAIPTQAGNDVASQQNQHDVVLVIINFLLNNSSLPGTGHPAPGTPGPIPPRTELISIVDGIEISVAGPKGREIQVRTTAGKLLFNLTKINSAGLALAANAAQWSCLRENSTGLIWEVKTRSPGLHRQNDTFTWPDSPLKAVNRGALPAGNSGATCTGYVPGDPSTYCNTQAFIARVNRQQLCGAQGWRLPTTSELEAIIALNRAAPLLYATIFPNGTSKALWSGSPLHGFPKFAWHVYANDGYAHGTDKSGNLPLLLVRAAHPL